MIFANGKILPTSEQNRVLNELEDRINETRAKEPLKTETVVNAIDALSRRIECGDFNDLIASLEIDNIDFYVAQAIKLLKRESIEYKLQTELGREPTVQEIARKLELPEEDVALALEAIQDPVSLCEPIGGDGADALTIGDQVRDDNVNAENWLQNIAIREAMDRLNEREQRILNLRFFQGRTQMEVAGEIGISQAQVSRLEKAALSHMRKLV